jgi:hypothetical protein
MRLLSRKSGPWRRRSGFATVPALVAAATSLCAAAGAFGAPAQPAAAAAPSQVEWSSMRGVEISAIPGWGKSFDAERTDRMLALAEGMGFNAVKTWLTSDSYFSDPEAMLTSVARFLELCRRRHLAASFLLFHAGGGSTTPEELGRSVEWISAEEALERSAPLLREIGKVRPGWAVFFPAYVRRYAQGAVVPFWGDPSQIFLQGSITDPPYSQWGEEHWPRYETYVRAVMERFGGDRNVVLWDVMGEPYLVANYPWLFALLDTKYDEDRVTRFLRHFTRYAASFDPAGAMTVGSGGADSARRVEEIVGDVTDVVSVHWFGPDPVEAKAVLETVRQTAAASGKPMLLTEFGNLTLGDSWTDDSRMLGTDEGQLRYYRDLMPVVEELGVGWFAYQLVAGEGAFSNAGLLYPSGLNRPAAIFLRQRLKGP